MRRTPRLTREQTANALIAFSKTVEKPFPDLALHPGESPLLREFLLNVAVRRRINLFRDGGLWPPYGSRKRRIFDSLDEDIIERDTYLRNACADERVSRMIRDGTI